MAFSQMLEILKEKEKGTIVFVKLGKYVSIDYVLVSTGCRIYVVYVFLNII